MAKVRIIAEVEPELERLVSVAAASNDQSVSEWVEDTIRQSLEQTKEAVTTSSVGVRPNDSDHPDEGRSRAVDTDTESVWDKLEAMARKNPAIHLSPRGAKPKGSINPPKLRGGSLISDAIIEDRR